MAKYAEILVPYVLAEVEFYVRETSADHSVRPSDVADVYPRSENDPTDDFGDQSRFGLILDLEGAGGHHLQCSTRRLLHRCQRRLQAKVVAHLDGVDEPNFVGAVVNFELRVLGGVDLPVQHRHE